MDKEAEVMAQRPELMICDTGPVVIKVWSQFKYGSVHPMIEKTVQHYRADLMILPDPMEVPFDDDPLRENPYDRAALFQMYLDELLKLDIPFIVVHGKLEERKQQIQDAIDPLIVQ